MPRQLAAAAIAAALLAGMIPARAGIFEDLGLPRPVPRSQIPPDRERGERQMEQPSRPTAPRPPDPAEEQRRLQDLANRVERVRARWLPLSTEATVTQRTTAVSIAPDSGFFGYGRSGAGLLSAPLARIGTTATSIGNESLRRGFAILQAAKSAGTPEEAAFLASQAGLAMEGAPLQVIVSPPIVADSGAARAAQALRPLIDKLGEEQIAVDEAKSEIVEVVKEYNQLRSEEQQGLGDPAVREERRKELSAAYTRATQNRREAEQRRAQIEMRVEIIVLRR